MKNTTKQIKLCSFFVLTFATAIGVVAFANNSSMLGSLAVEDHGIWYHYAAVEPTCARYGIREYWTDCNGTTVITQPAGQFEERTLTEDQINGIVAITDDPRLITEKKEHQCTTFTVGTPIGYKTGKCSQCGGPVSALVEDADIAAAGQDWGLCNYFGGNGTSMNKGSLGEFPEYADLVGCKSAWHNGNGSEVVKNVLLPKVNFTLFNNVSFVFHTNSNTAANTAYGLGLTETGVDLFAYSPRGVRDQYVLDAAFNKEDGKLNVSLTSNFVSKSFVIDNDDVESGKGSISMYVKLGAWRTFLLDSVILNQSDTSSNVVVDDFSTCKYGAEAATGAKMITGQDSITNCLTWKSSNDTTLETTIGLPKITYINYDKVVFNLFFNGGDSWSEIVGLDTDNASKISTKDGHTLTIYRTDDGMYKAKLELTYGGSRPTFETTIADTDVLAGNKCFYGIYYKASGPWRNVCLTSFVINPTE